MALSNENNKISYTPSAGTTAFDGWNISYFNNSDVVVNIETASGTITTFINETGFSVVATNGDPATGATITLDVATVAGDTVTISREVPYTQEYDLQDGSTIDPTALNKALDRTVAQSQQIVDDANRHLTHPVTDPAGLNYEAPSVTARASKVVGWDTNGKIIAVDVGGGGGLIGVDTSKGLAVSGGIVEGKVDGTTLAFSSGDFSVKTGGIGDTQISDVASTKITGTILEAQIGAGAVTLSKIDADASLTAKGVIEQSTDAEVITGTDSDRAVSPSNIEALFGSSGRKNHVTNGYQKFPSGLIMQWGFSSTMGETTVDFTTDGNIDFPNACLNVSITNQRTTGTSGTTLSPWIRTISTTGFGVYISGNADGFYWTAIGI